MNGRVHNLAFLSSILIEHYRTGTYDLYGVMRHKSINIKAILEQHTLKFIAALGLVHKNKIPPKT